MLYGDIDRLSAVDFPHVRACLEVEDVVGICFGISGFSRDLREILKSRENSSSA